MIKRFSPAKGNLFFRVLSKRPDGYHEVASLYTALDLGDWIQIRHSSSEDKFSSNEKTLLHDSSNLIIRARESFRKITSIFDPIAIDLEKNIPIGAGLGGGSSNVATTLWIMNELFEKPLSLDELIILAAGIGSDPSFFFSEGFAYCTGRGEVLHDLDFSWNIPCWIAKPEYALSTPHVYSVCTPKVKPDPLTLVQAFRQGSPIFANDLEQAAFQLLPELKGFKQALKNLGFSDVVMTGSGSAFLCFGDVDNPKLSHTTFYSVKPIQRSLLSWY